MDSPCYRKKMTHISTVASHGWSELRRVALRIQARHNMKSSTYKPLVVGIILVTRFHILKLSYCLLPPLAVVKIPWEKQLQDRRVHVQTVAHSLMRSSMEAKSQEQELEAAVSRKTRPLVLSLLPPFIQISLHKPREWCCPLLEWVFPLQLT